MLVLNVGFVQGCHQICAVPHARVRGGAERMLVLNPHAKAFASERVSCNYNGYSRHRLIATLPTLYVGSACLQPCHPNPCQRRLRKFRRVFGWRFMLETVMLALLNAVMVSDFPPRSSTRCSSFRCRVVEDPSNRVCHQRFEVASKVLASTSVVAFSRPVLASSAAGTHTRRQQFSGHQTH